MIVHRIARQRPYRQRLEILLRSLQGPLNARINVVALLKVYVLKQIAADRSGGDGTTVHLDALHMRDRALHGHKALTKVFINRRRRVGCGHRKSLRQDESGDVRQGSSLRSGRTMCEFTSESYLANRIFYMLNREPYLVGLTSHHLAFATAYADISILKPPEAMPNSWL